MSADDQPKAIPLSPVARKFILHWGEMGTRWGVNRTVGQIHALFYLSPKPLSAEEIAETLSIARSNAGSGLRELESWRLIRHVSELGDRRWYYEPVREVWEMFRLIADERKRREIDPTIATLCACLAELNDHDASDEYVKNRLEESLAFLETMSSLYDEFRRAPTGLLRNAMLVKERIKWFFPGGAP